MHIPFCVKKCFYCDFVSFPGMENLHKRYIDCLTKELKQEWSKLCNDYFISSVYIGGGTPSSIDSGFIDGLLKILKDAESDAEITMEMNPGTKFGLENVTNNVIDFPRVNRLSIGLQSANNEILNQIGRIHSFEQFVETYNYARNVGVNNINVDLMIGLPNQTICDLKDSLEKVISLQPEHVSVYSLIIEEGTKLYELSKRGMLFLPDEEKERQMYWYAKNTLELNGYKHYEISNFAKPGFESKHNVNCWKQKEYVGVGLAASSYLHGVRYVNISDLYEYMDNIESNRFDDNRIIQEVQSADEMQREFMLLGLRMIDGVSISDFKSKFRENPVFALKNELSGLVDNGLIIIDGDRIKLTNKGLDLANQVWMQFV